MFKRSNSLKGIDTNCLMLNCEGRNVTLLNGSLFISLMLNCEGKKVTLLKGSIFNYLMLNCEGRDVTLLKLSIFIYLVLKMGGERRKSFKGIDIFLFNIKF